MGNRTKYNNIIKTGTYEITALANTLSYVIPFTGTINNVQIIEIKNSLLSGYFSDFIVEINPSVGINIIYYVQPPIGQKINFSYFII